MECRVGSRGGGVCECVSVCVCECVCVGGVGVQDGRLLQVKDSGQERWMGGKEQMFQSLESAWAG